MRSIEWLGMLPITLGDPKHVKPPQFLILHCLMHLRNW